MNKNCLSAAVAAAIALAAVPAIAQTTAPTATEYQNRHGGKAVVGGNGQRAGVQSANGSKAYAGPKGAGYNGKNSAAYNGSHSSGTYNKNSGQYNVNGTKVQCSGTKDAQGNCVKK
jgi:hypothetical protein